MKWYKYTVYVEVPDLDEEELGHEEYNRQMDEATKRIDRSIESIPGYIEDDLEDIGDA